jgi:mxaJ protein
LKRLLPLLLWTCAASHADVPRVLNVCADPNNLPFSNRAEQGFENKIAALMAKDMGVRLNYVWWVQRRGFVRNTLNEARCDLWLGIASGIDRVATSHPYYRSTYVFVTRSADRLQALTLDDARLRSRLVGVQMIGNNAVNTPPAHAVASRGIIDNVRGYMLYGDYSRPNPTAAIIDAVEDGQIDVALVWGPTAGYFAKASKVPLRLEPVTPADDPQAPMTYAISVGVRKGDTALLTVVDATLAREQARIHGILEAYGVPQI